MSIECYVFQNNLRMYSIKKALTRRLIIRFPMILYGGFIQIQRIDRHIWLNRKIFSLNISHTNFVL